MGLYLLGAVSFWIFCGWGLGYIYNYLEYILDKNIFPFDKGAFLEIFLTQQIVS